MMTDLPGSPNRDADDQAQENVELVEPSTDLGVFQEFMTSSMAKVMASVTTLDKRLQIAERCNTPPSPTSSRRSTSQPEQGTSHESLQQLQLDSKIAGQVDHRLRTLRHTNTTDSKGMLELFPKLILKSGRGRIGTEAPVVVQVDWPQDHVFIGLDRSKCLYDELTLAQWCTGFTAIIALRMEAKDFVVASNMTIYFRDAMQEVVDLGFASVRGAHAVVLSHIETGRLTWNEVGAPSSLRRQYVSRVSVADSPPWVKTTKPSQTKISNSKPCMSFNKGSCTSSYKEHIFEGVKVAHICAFCFEHGGRRYAHNEADCKNKNK